MPTDTPAAAPSPVAKDLLEIAKRYHARRVQFGAPEANNDALDGIEALLAPVREALHSGLVWSTFDVSCDDDMKMRAALASLSPPEAHNG
jgi:hypothetical protein